MTAEKVSLLNDMCTFTPSDLADKRLTCNEIDSLSTKVTLTNGKYAVSAILFFNEVGQWINFRCDDRSAMQNGGTMIKNRWTTPVSDYKEFDERMVPTVGKTFWHYPEGDFTYGVFKLKCINYNLSN